MKNYTETVTFKDEVEELRKNGVCEESTKEYTEIYSKFDENGNDVGMDYANVILAYTYPIP